MNDQILNSCVVSEAHERIKSYIHRTPLLQSEILNRALGHKIIFKSEINQKIGAFKARGAINTLLHLQEMGKLPKEVVAFSSGNHGQAVAWASKIMGIKATICLPPHSSKIKAQAAKAYGANVIMCETRQEAELKAEKMQSDDCYFIHPSSNDMIIAGAGTAVYEALQDNGNIDAVFAACGGGGLLAGTYLASKLILPETKIFAAEPLIANDAARSVREGKIVRFNEPPPTIADGVRTLGVTPKIFNYLKLLDGFYEITEEEIIYWTAWLMHLLKITCEPTSALTMAAAARWLKEQKEPKEVIVLLSGGNIDQQTYQMIWQKNMLALPLTIDSANVI